MEKKHITMVVGGYYPNPSPTGKCSEQYISLVQDEFEIDVVCIENINNCNFQYNAKNVYPVSCKYVKFQKSIKDRYKLIYLVSKLLLRFWNCFHQPNNLHWYYKAAYKKLEEINSENPIDVIFSSGAPIAAHCAAMKFKELHPATRWVSYSVDSYAAQNQQKKRFINFERNVISKSDYVLLSEEIYKNSSFLYDSFRERVCALPYLLPHMSKNNHQNFIFDNDKINFVYAGSFYRRIRNPIFLLKTFMLMSDNMVLHLFCTSDCEDLINQIVASSSGKIIRHEIVGPDEIPSVYDSADVLVSVGNSLPEFKPSKTFEYIASRKPIVNFFYNGNRDDVLDSYPMSLQICNSKDVKLAAKELEAFGIKYAHKMVLEDQVIKEYSKHMPLSIRNILINAIRGELDG